LAIAPERLIYEGTRIPSPIPSVLELPDELRSSDDIVTINFGPNHPSTHGVLRLVVDLHGEEVVGLLAVVGYLHTGFEKNMEQKTWWKAITYPERIDYLSFQNNELVFVLAIEKLLEIHVDSRIPSSPLVPRSINQGKLLWFDKRRSDVSKGVEAFADRLMTKLTPEAVVPTNGAHRRRRR